ncbi:hypothetical protein QJS64_05450 [Paraclostridium bifermentans]|uniref:Zinc transporter permease n=1 Tax=Paraclostridium bifermentans TaxID=1490 RepID=A0ABY8R4V4_PARBF|nr:hypothetical protein QJS64_05450 [Paraclostridium bifermentans]
MSDHQHQHVHNGEIVDDDDFTPSKNSKHSSNHKYQHVHNGKIIDEK